MEATALALHALLPGQYAGRPVLTSTVDAAARTHWLLGERPENSGPYSALLITAADDSTQETRLHGIEARSPILDALPDDTFVIAEMHSGRNNEHQAQLFGHRGRAFATFPLGGELGAFLADQTGSLWIAYDDKTEAADIPGVSPTGLARFSHDGAREWTYPSVPEGANYCHYCHVLNVGHDVTWAYSLDFGLLEFKGETLVSERTSLNLKTSGLAVRGDVLAYATGPGTVADRITLCTLTETSAEPVAEYALNRPEGSPLGARRIITRGPRLYLQDARNDGAWYLFEL